MENENLILAELQKMNSRLGCLEGKVDTIQTDVSGLKSDVSELKTDVSGLKADVSGLKAAVSKLDEDLSELKEAHEITRSGVNSLIEWTDAVSLVDRFPLPHLQ